MGRTTTERATAAGRPLRRGRRAASSVASSTRRPGGRRAVWIVALLALTTATSGCARVFGQYDVAPNGLARDDDHIRRMLAQQTWQRVDSAADTLSAHIRATVGRADGGVAPQAAGRSPLLALLDTGEHLPSDPLLNQLYAGVVAYHAGDYRRSARLFDDAALLADDRMTNSLSREALAFISSDRVIPYETAEAERLLMHYYAALAFLQEGDAEAAAVEARRLSARLALHEPDDERMRELHGALRHFAGAVFAHAGFPSDAAVARRNAFALAGMPDSLAWADVPRDSLDVYVVVDRGFVGHRVEQSVLLHLPGDEVRMLRGDGGEKALMATAIAARVLDAAAHMSHGKTRFGQITVPAPARAQRPRGGAVAVGFGDDDAGRASGTVGRQGATPGGAGVTTGDSVRGPDAGAAESDGKAPDGFAHPANDASESDDEDEDRKRDEAPYLMRIAWPAFYDADPRPGGVNVAVDSLPAAVLASANVSDAVLVDFERQRPLLVAKTIARSAAKMSLTRALRDEIENDGVAELVGFLGNLTAAATEQADTRSWTLLPGSVAITRVRVPADGAHDVRVRVDGVERVVRGVRGDGGATVIRHVSVR